MLGWIINHGPDLLWIGAPCLLLGIVNEWADTTGAPYKDFWNLRAYYARQRRHEPAFEVIKAIQWRIAYWIGIPTFALGLLLTLIRG